MIAPISIATASPRLDSDMSKANNVASAPSGQILEAIINIGMNFNLLTIEYNDISPRRHMHSSGIPIDLLTRETIRTSNNPVTANKPYHVNERGVPKIRT